MCRQNKAMDKSIGAQGRPILCSETEAGKTPRLPVDLKRPFSLGRSFHYSRDFAKFPFDENNWRRQLWRNVKPWAGAKFVFVHERGARWLPVSTSNCCCMLIGWKSAKVFPRCYFEPSRKLGCAVWKLLEVALDKLSLLTVRHHYRFHDDFQSSQLPMLKQHLCWLPVITIVPMVTCSYPNSVHVKATSVLTASHHYRFHGDFQSSQQTQSGESHVSRQSACSGWRQLVIHECWLEVIGLLAHVRIQMSPPGHHVTVLHLGDVYGKTGR